MKLRQTASRLQCSAVDCLPPGPPRACLWTAKIYATTAASGYENTTYTVILCCSREL